MSVSRDDGLKLIDCYVTATCRCAPPANKLLSQEILNCRPFLLREIELLKRVMVVVGLGKVGFDNAFEAYRELGLTALKARPRFAHGTLCKLNERVTLLGSFHPSQQNTFTGKLTQAMFDAVFRKVRQLLP
jgi:uracil-DNA glycosylase family 4